MGDLRDVIAVNERLAYLAQAEEFAEVGRKTITSVIEGGFNTAIKVDRSFVTAADLQIEQDIRANVKRLFPTHGVIGEEFGTSNPQAEYQWTVDPIDGTEEFINNVPTYGSVIGLYYRKLPMVGVMDHPALDLRLSGAFGCGVKCNGDLVRCYSDTKKPVDEMRVGMSKRKNYFRVADEGHVFDHIVDHFPNIRILDTCYTFTSVILGGLDVVLEYNLRIWDLAAAQVLIPEVGGEYVTLSERDTGNGSPYLCAVFGKPWAVAAVCGVVLEIAS